MSEDSQKAMPAVPNFIYGTAWKEERTEELTQLALESGFLAIDTANQRKHYHEAGVGKGLQNFLQKAPLERDSLFLQTKFTYTMGQDHRLPYEANASFRDQLIQSFESSLEHLGVDYLDSYLLHGPSHRSGISEQDWEVWQAMEELQRTQRVRWVGISNVSLEQLQVLWQRASIKPSFVQNRCFASLGWDAEVRGFCQDVGILYQGFSLLTANLRELSQPSVLEIAKRHQRTLPQIVFRFSQQVGMIPLTGTTQAKHMEEDLNLEGFELSSEEIDSLLSIG